MIWQGENVSQQMNLVETRLRAARNNALSFVNVFLNTEFEGGRHTKRIRKI